MKFYVGTHQPSDTKHLHQAFISINRLRGPYGRKAPLPPQLVEAIIDCGGFTELERYGEYRHPPEVYADDCAPWCRDGRVSAIVAQDYMCEPFMLAKTGLTVADHQRLTIERYDKLLAYWRGHLGMAVPVMPVLQGYTVKDYMRHLLAYGDRLTPGMHVGVGSICKRQGDPLLVWRILRAIKRLRPDLRLHGFGLKLTALKEPRVLRLLHTADSMAWSFSARKQGRSANDWREAAAFTAKVEALAEGS